MRTPDDRAAQTMTLVPPTVGEDQKTSAYLLVIESGSSYALPLPRDGVLLIGRAQDADLRVQDGTASRRHARLIVMGGAAQVIDLGSHNGTRIDGELLAAPRPLRGGEVISICGTTLVYQRARSADDQAEAQPEQRLVLGERTILVADPAMARLFELVRRLAGSDLPVLITGETGAGKENTAYAVHHHSPRADGPFIAVNCAAIPESLAESELFGHERGAFSGALAARAGLLESAHRGTVFLDEVGELALPVQAKLLRALESRRITRLGESRERPVDIRLVAATNRDLEAEVRAGRFRQDLFFRLGAATVVLPPLRQRPGEIRALSRHFLDAACERVGAARKDLSPGALEALLRHGWPGNVRELRNTMDYLVATVEGALIDARHLPERVRPAPPAGAAEATGSGETAAEPATPGEAPSFRPLADELRDLERQRILEAMAACGGNQTRAAELIGMPLRTFVLRLKQYGVPGPRKGGARGDHEPE